MRIQLKGMSFRMESGNVAFGNGEKEEKVFVGIVDEEEEKVLHLREAQRQKGEKVTHPYYNVRMY